MSHAKILLILLLLGNVLSACAATRFTGSAQAHTECVVLLHGLARSSRSMNRLQAALIEHGYAVLNLNYPSTDLPIEALSEDILALALQQYDTQAYQKIHFVTHSMGGIVLRYFLKQRTLPNLGRVVMLSPPNRGSQLVDKLGSIIFFKWLNGPAGNQLSTAADSVPNRLGPVDFELAVITGRRSLNPFYSWLIPGQDDGKVAVDHAKVDGMAAFQVVPASHTFIMRSEPVIQSVISYLSGGRLTAADMSLSH